MTIQVHHEKCTPDEPCGMCIKREDNIVAKYEKKIEDFFSINWGNRGLAAMTSAERLDDQRIMRNPME